MKKRLVEFFEHTDNNPTHAEHLPTPSQLAVFLGYSSAQAMYRDINNPEVAPEYAQLLDRAVDILKDNLQRRQLRYAEARSDWQGVDAILQRMDKAQERTEPVEDKDKNINININIEKQERIKGFIDEKMELLMAQAEVIEPKELTVSDSDVSP